MRYLTSFIQKDLSRKLVFLAGARQVGKSTLAKSDSDRKSYNPCETSELAILGILELNLALKQPRWGELLD